VSLKIKEVSLQHFRSFVSFSDAPSQGINVILGDNACGKTNLIEAIQLLTMMESFRNPTWGDVVMWEESMARVTLTAGEGSRLLKLEATFSPGERIYCENENRCRPNELRGKIPAVLFTPDDLRMIKGSPQRRRSTLDSLGGQLSSVYFRMRNDLEKLVAQRNRLLKDRKMSPELLESWTEGLVSIGCRFISHRKHLFSILRDQYLSIFPKLSPCDEADLCYESSWSKALGDAATPESLWSFYQHGGLSQELQQGTTLYGPHRDDIRFVLNGKDARKFASQGQQRTAVLAWKLAEVETICQITSRQPILLLDDVMSELDASRRTALLAYIEKRGLQAFITSANEDYFSERFLSDAHVVRLSP
jgi:DNA replication and repair protein RecF